jgi:hypothetical protein
VTIAASGGTGALSYTFNGVTNTTGVFTGVSAGTGLSYSVTDANNCGPVTGTINVTQPSQLTANCSNNNAQLYFGYSGDQSATITVTGSGGTGPYKSISITMDRALKCNQVTDGGDETWTGGSGGTTTGNGCLAFPNTTSSTPVSVKNNCSSYSVNVSLMADAWIIATITDANNCVAVCSTFVSAEDVRCFAGNSTIAKVTLCHKTGSTKNPWVTICVDQDAVPEHLAHGDCYGPCPKTGNPSCVTSTSTSSVSVGTLPQSKPFNVKVTNNPSFAGSEFGLSVQGDNKESVNIIVTNMFGEKVFTTKGAVNTTYRFGANWRSGTYIIQVIQGKNIKTIKVVKGEG